MEEPITLAEARLQVRLLDPDDTSEDELLAALIPAAREHVEEHTGLALVQRPVTDAFDRFGKLELSAWPIADPATIEISYLDSIGASHAVTGFRLIRGRRPALLLPAIGAAWPMAGYAAQGVTVAYTAGYAATDDVPRSIKQAMLLLIGHWWANREASVVGVAATELPLALEALLRPHKPVVIA